MKRTKISERGLGEEKGKGSKNKNLICARKGKGDPVIQGGGDGIWGKQRKKLGVNVPGNQGTITKGKGWARH